MPIKNILVVDDSPTDRQFLSDLLAKNGYKVPPRRARRRRSPRSKQPAARPRADGRGDAGPERLPGDARPHASDEATKHIPVIICTTKGQETDKIWGMQQGAQGLRRQAGGRGRAAGEDRGARLMARAHLAQGLPAELADAAARAPSAGRTASKLGVQAGADGWLVELTEASEMIPVPPITPGAADPALVQGRGQRARQPLQRGRFPGVPRRRAGEPERAVAPAAPRRALPHRARALLVDRSLGLRNAGAAASRRGDAARRAWVRARIRRTRTARTWRELDVRPAGAARRISERGVPEGGSHGQNDILAS